MYLYIAYTADELGLPVAVRDNLTEIAKALKINLDTACKRVKYGSTGKYDKLKIEKIEV